jgi:NitT/TauT family transport system ATP-binding protein
MGIRQEEKASFIKIRDLTKKFEGDTVENEVVALKNINLNIESGEFVSVIGPSGCGKSTLLYILAGLIDQTSGEVLMDGDPVSGPGPDRAIVFQDIILFPWRSVYDNVKFGLELRENKKRIKNQNGIVEDLLDMVGLEDFADRNPYELSGGMQQRVALARSLAIDPAVLLMDEPFGALDSQTKQQLQMELLKLWRDTNKTIVFVTHDITEAVFLSDRVVILESRPGQVKEIFDLEIPRPRQIADLYTEDMYGEYISKIRKEFPEFD